MTDIKEYFLLIRNSIVRGKVNRDHWSSFHQGKSFLRTMLVRTNDHLPCLRMKNKLRSTGCPIIVCIMYEVLNIWQNWNTYTANIFNVIFTLFTGVPLSTVIPLYFLHFVLSAVWAGTVFGPRLCQLLSCWRLPRWFYPEKLPKQRHPVKASRGKRTLITET